MWFSSQQNHRTHYDTLGVSPEASLDEIKQAFRQLSKQTHPDVNPSASAHEFKQVNEAATVLTNAEQRRKYDAQLLFQNTRNPSYAFRNANKMRGPSAAPAATPFSIFWTTAFRPRNIAIAFIGVYTTVAAVNMLVAPKEDRQDTVQAWKNPQTGKWEQPAPWDPLYKQLRPPLQNVPRHLVQSRHR